MSDKKITIRKTTLSDNYCIQVKISRRIPNGVYLFTETVQFGHAFVLAVKDKVNVAYTYGRYAESDSETLGVLLRYEGAECKDYLMEELYRYNAKVFKISDVNESDVFKIGDSIWTGSNKIPERGSAKHLKTAGKVLDRYKLFSRNCTTFACDMLRKAGTKIFHNERFEKACRQVSTMYTGGLINCSSYSNEYFIDPEGLENYLEELSNSLENNLVLNYSKNMRVFVLNSKNYSYSPVKELYRTVRGHSS